MMLHVRQIKKTCICKCTAKYYLNVNLNTSIVLCACTCTYMYTSCRKPLQCTKGSTPCYINVFYGWLLLWENTAPLALLEICTHTLCYVHTCICTFPSQWYTCIHVHVRTYLNLSCVLGVVSHSLVPLFLCLLQGILELLLVIGQLVGKDVDVVTNDHRNTSPDTLQAVHIDIHTWHIKTYLCLILYAYIHARTSVTSAWSLASMHAYTTIWHLNFSTKWILNSGKFSRGPVFTVFVDDHLITPQNKHCTVHVPNGRECMRPRKLNLWNGKDQPSRTMWKFHAIQ